MTRQHGSLLKAMEEGGEITHIHKHATNDRYVVHVKNTENILIAYTNVSMETMEDLSKSEYCWIHEYFI